MAETKEVRKQRRISMKKPSIIIGKKQIIMTCLTLLLAIAVYINYTTMPLKDNDDNELIDFK